MTEHGKMKISQLINRRNFITAIVIIITSLISYLVITTVGIYKSGASSTYKNVSDMEKFEVVIVFGAGIRPDGTPHDMLYDRLVATAEVYNSGKANKILVSGDNRFKNYDEPSTMRNYLINEFGIPAEDIVADFAGRRTYDTCKRAGELWNVSEALLITQGYHLPRAIFTCNQLGIKSYGYSATLNDYIGFENYKFREFLAIQKAIIDVYFVEPSYVGGPKEEALMR